MPPDSINTPTGMLQAAIKAVPAVKHALGIGGIIAVIAIVAGGFKLDWSIAVFGAIVMFLLMTVLVIFSRLASANVSIFRAPMIVLTWFSLILMMGAAIALFSSVFLTNPWIFENSL
jgi:hypothetical protein